MPEISQRRVCVLGQHELDYPRNVINQRLMRAAGYRVTVCRSRAFSFARTFSILRQYARVAGDNDVVFVSEGAQRHMLWIKLAALLARHTIVFDPFISLYGTEVEDRALHRPLSFGGIKAAWRDFASCHLADHLIFDTPAHRDYFFERYRLRKPSTIVRVGVDEEVFKPAAEVPVADGFNVLFYGTYIPLQGIDVIVRAAELLRDEPDVRFTLIGDGQEAPRVRASVERAGLSNLRLVAPTQPEGLAEFIARADVCLGIFGTGIKAGLVVPNKVVQCAAMAKPIITRRSAAIERDFRDGADAKLIEPGDPAGLARAIRELRAAPALRRALAEGARRVFERCYAVAAQTEVMREVLDQAAAMRGA